MTEERLKEIRAMVNTGFIPAPGNATVAQLLEYSDSLDAENIRLHNENQSLRRSLTSEAVKDAKYNAEIMRLRKELEEERKQAEAVRKAMQDVLYYLQRDSYIPAQDILEQYLAMGQEGEGNHEPDRS